MHLPTPPCPAPPFPTLPHPTPPYPTLLYPTLLYPILPYPTLPYFLASPAAPGSMSFACRLTTSSAGKSDEGERATDNIGALTSRLGVWGILYYNYNKEPPKQYRPGSY